MEDLAYNIKKAQNQCAIPTKSCVQRLSFYAQRLTGRLISTLKIPSKRLNNSRRTSHYSKQRMKMGPRLPHGPNPRISGMDTELEPMLYLSTDLVTCVFGTGPSTPWT